MVGFQRRSHVSSGPNITHRGSTSVSVDVCQDSINGHPDEPQLDVLATTVSRKYRSSPFDRVAASSEVDAIDGVGISQESRRWLQASQDPGSGEHAEAFAPGFDETHRDQDLHEAWRTLLPSSALLLMLVGRRGHRHGERQVLPSLGTMLMR